jgi:CSLREA domain-containing protein
MKRLFAHMRPAISIPILAVSLLAVLKFLPVSQSAALLTSFTVNTTVDTADANPGDGVCADSLGRCSLRAAVMEANAGTGPNTINVPAGTYTLTQGPFDNEFNFDGAEEATGDLDIQNNDVTIVGAGTASTIIDGGGIDRIFDVNNFSGSGVTVNATFQDLTLRNGNAPTTPEGFFEAGGAIQFDGTNFSGANGVLTINNCRITGNTASGLGGGIFATNASVVIDGSVISNNTSTHGNGGGMVYDGPLASDSLQITNTNISGNNAPDATFGNGGGLWVGGGLTKTIKYNSITNNNAGANGGGVFNGNNGLTLNFNVIVGNSSASGSTGLRNNSGAVDAMNNWWGCNQGPGSSPCDRASGPMGFGITQWLALNHTATPNPIQVNQSTTLQADFFSNNLGSPIAAADLAALNGRTVTFNNPVLGTISGAGTQISGGKANATFNAGSTGGNGSADATVDHATVTAPIEIDQPTSVTSNPSDQTVCDGATATFTASASGFPAPTVQWQVSTNGGGTFTNISGATSTTLSFTASAAQNGNQYRAVFTNSSGTQTTTAATLTVKTAPSVTSSPADQAVCDGATATFTAASNDPAATVQWQVSTGGPFSNIPGATSATLSFTASASQNGNQYRAVFTNSCGSSPTTAATLTINPSTSATTPADQTVCQGASASFSTTASGTGPFSYAWTVDGSAVVGNTSSISVPTGSLSSGSHSVSVVVSGTCGTVTKSATLTVNANTSATDLVNQTVCKGATATFSTTASGTGPFHYAWTLDGAPFNGDSPSISVPTGSLSAGSHSVSVVVSGTCGTVTKSATLTIDSSPPTIDCPANIVVEPSCPSGAVVTYQAPVGTDSCPGAVTTQTAGLPSGSVFPIGTTTETYTVTDSTGQTASCSFTVTVKTPAATIQDMINQVQALMNQGLLNQTNGQSLITRLQSALDYLNAGKPDKACDKLADFIQKTQNFIATGVLTSAQGQPLIDSANHLRNTLGCSNTPGTCT